MKGSYCSKSIEKLKVIIGVGEKDEDIVFMIWIVMMMLLYIMYLSGRRIA